MPHAANRKLILGSTSPYRRELLSRLRIPFEVVCLWLPKWFAIQIGHLIRANDHAGRVHGGYGAGLGHGQPAGQMLGCFGRIGRFIHIRRHDLKRYAQA